VLTDLCARNIAGDIQYELTSDSVKSARFRFLQLDSDVICIDQPQNIQEEVTLKSGQAVTVFFTQGNDRWSFESRIVKLSRIVRLNNKQRVVGMAIALPEELHVQQRRRDYRVAVASLGLKCRMMFESKTNEFACDLDSESFECFVRDISSCGMAIVFFAEGCARSHHRRRLFLEFDLDDGQGPRVSVAEVRHEKTIGANRKQLWGLRLLPTPSVDLEELRADLSRFVADEQRRKLRRRR